MTHIVTRPHAMAGLGGIPAGYVPSAPEKIQLPLTKQIEEPVQLSAEQQKVLDAVAAGDNVIVEATVGSGKALLDSSRLPTPQGWRLVGDIRPGDQVYTPEGTPTTVLNIFPQGAEDVYEVTLADGRRTLCSGDHNWLVRKMSRRIEKWEVLTTREILAGGLMQPSGNGFRFRIPTHQALESEPVDHDIDPYVIGVFLGNGCCTEKGLTLSSPSAEIPDKVADLLGMTVRKRSEHNHSWDFFDADGRRPATREFFAQMTEQLCVLSGEKSIPEQYLRGSITQRLALVQGLMDTDGSIMVNGGRYNVTFSTTSGVMVRQLSDLLGSLGWTATVSVDNRGEEKYSSGACYTLVINMANVDKQKLFTLSTKHARAVEAASAPKRRVYSEISIADIRKLDYQAPMTCFEVEHESHLFLADDFVVTHNTATIQQLCSIQPRDKEVLYLTYSRLLKQEAQARVRGAKVQNYHGIVYPYLRKHGLRCGISESIRVFNDNFERIAPDVPVYDLLVIDEYQDINEQYAQLIRNIVSRNPTMQIVMVGDPDQKVQSNSVINTQDFAREITASTGRGTQQLLFTQSFRMGAQMGELLSAGWNKPVKGMNHTQKLTEMVPGEVVEYLAQFDPGDILCLGQRRGSMTGVLNQLEKRYPEKFNKYSVYAAVRERDEQGSFADDTAVFTTFDASKGMERKVCVVFDYHEKYWGIRAGFPDVNYEVLRNIFLVAASRGKEEIVFVRNGDYPALDLDAVRDEVSDEAGGDADGGEHGQDHDVDAEAGGEVDSGTEDTDTADSDGADGSAREEPEYIGGVSLKVLRDLPDMLTPRYEKAVSVTECFDFKYAEDVEECMRHIRRTRLDDGESDVIDIQRSDGLIDLSAPVGFYQEMVFFEGYDPGKEMVSVMRALGWSKGDYLDKLDEKEPWYNARFLSWMETGQDRYIKQVKKKISDVDTAALMKRLSTRLRRSAEHQITVTGDYEITGRHPGKGHPISTSLSLVGEMDAIDDHGEVYELKFTSALTEPMFLQLATYLVLSGHDSGVLWNTRTDERWRVSVPDRDAYMDAVVTCMSKRWYTRALIPPHT